MSIYHQLFERGDDTMKKFMKKIIPLTLIFGLLLIGYARMDTDAKVIAPKASGKTVNENEQMVIDYSNSDKGYVMVKYKKSTKVKLKAQVKCPTGNTYTYNLTPKKWASFPFSEGNGTYKVSVFVNLSGNSYATAGSQEIQVNMKDPMSPFLTSSQYVNYTSSTKCVKKANSLCKKTKDEMGKVEKVYNWTIKYFKYDKNKAKTVESGYLPELDRVYKSKKGICFDYAATMVAMLRSQGVPTKLVVGYAGSAYHAWISVYTEEQGWIDDVIYFDGVNWNRMDPTFASSSNSSKKIMEYIGDGKNYKEKYVY